MGTATRKAHALAKKLQTLSFDQSNPSAARKELLRMTTQSQWKNRQPVPGRGAKSFHKPGNLKAQPLLSGRAQSHAVQSF